MASGTKKHPTASSLKKPSVIESIDPSNGGLHNDIAADKAELL